MWECCADWYNGSYYAFSPATDPTGPANGTYRVLRGGSWFNFPRFLRMSYRHRFVPAYRDDFIGFRCVGDE